MFTCLGALQASLTWLGFIELTDRLIVVSCVDGGTTKTISSFSFLDKTKFPSFFMLTFLSKLIEHKEYQ
tara:strand:+ start:10704 stop:10910 length:207 start_codon:yes stop_codon:yes gene_type:complete